MVNSDWGDWLPREIQAANPEGVDVWYLGCNGFVLKATDGTTVLIDPYLGTGDPPRTIRMIPVPFAPEDVGHCDAVLASHEHTDHVHGPSQGPILASTDAKLYAPDDALAVTQEEDWTNEWGVDSDQLHEVTEGDTFNVGSLTIHVEGANDPDASHPVSYVIKHESGTFFHGGDARPGEAFESVGNQHDIDLAALAFGSKGMVLDSESGEPTETTWYSGENMVVDAARQVSADRLLPTHWDMWKGLTADPAALHPHVRSFERPRRLELLEIGDRTTV